MFLWLWSTWCRGTLRHRPLAPFSLSSLQAGFSKPEAAKVTTLNQPHVISLAHPVSVFKWWFHCVRCFSSLWPQVITYCRSFQKIPFYYKVFMYRNRCSLKMKLSFSVSAALCLPRVLIACSSVHVVAHVIRQAVSCLWICTYEGQIFYHSGFFYHFHTSILPVLPPCFVSYLLHHPDPVCISPAVIAKNNLFPVDLPASVCLNLFGMLLWKASYDPGHVRLCLTASDWWPDWAS